MSIRREELDAGRVDLDDVTTGRRVPPTRLCGRSRSRRACARAQRVGAAKAHPGAIPRPEFLEPMAISVYALAAAIKVPRSRVNDVVRGRRSITVDTALRLARYFGTTPEFWVDLQARYDLEMAKDAARGRIKEEVAPRVG